MNGVVATRHGDMRGSVADGSHAFKGVRYAAPPSGAHRFQPITV
jgi:para-nitrobenzyl esterase